ncbi:MULTISPECIES: N-acyl amino acid synthase FeeM domain-containing protein [unclassified Ketobacter]|mgnify:CR=1 FL=1|uniref:N-acyl amino acid synthase FeeM domain-containing protein n=1 Tax=unclassified Ketobacter TaxID=2639109 RepID=UPI0025BFCFCC|nr:MULTISPECIES: hypothetical protein [unclassified Ketobacter]MEC8811841.1 hypothetical protein [Pseudomonadota bacterium]|tara:strand:- start:42738 stop:44213 length:1476 start_codon:yes stop_codon:yes gene_type:complete
METTVKFSSREGRRIVRQQLNGNHGVDATWVAGSVRVSVTLLDISSLGFAIELPAEHEAQVNVRDPIKLIVSPLMDVSYNVQGWIIDKQQTGDTIKLSAVIVHDNADGHQHLTPIELSSQDTIRGQFQHPFFYRQNFYFNVESLSARGFYLTGIDLACVLFSGMRITLRLGVFDGDKTIDGYVSEVSSDEHNGQRCFVRFEALTKAVEKQLAQYCFHYLKKTPRELRRSGLRSYFVKGFVQFKFVETQQEYEDVLDLRRRNYAAVRKVAADAPLKKLSYFFDRYSRILVVYHQGRAIGTATIIIGKRGEQPMEVEVLMQESDFSQLPPYEQTFEVAALCLDKGYRDTDILHGMFEHIYTYAMMNGRNYIVISSDKYLMDMYKTVGFQDTGFSFVQPKYRDLKMSVMLMDDFTTKWGKGMNPVTWWGVWGSVSMYLYKHRIIHYSLPEKIRVYGSRWLFGMTLRWRELSALAKERVGQRHAVYHHWKRVNSR